MPRPEINDARISAGVVCPPELEARLDHEAACSAAGHNLKESPQRPYAVLPSVGLAEVIDAGGQPSAEPGRHRLSSVPMKPLDSPVRRIPESPHGGATWPVRN